MAVVYQASDQALGRTVAVKLMRFDGPGEAGSARHSDEVAVLAHLNHFALVTLYDAGVEVIDGIPRSFMVTEFIDGTDLRSHLLTGPMAPGEVARLGADLCEALHYMGSLGITHRDIKPANVLLAPSDFPGRVVRAKLADFGIARLFDATHRTETGTVVGTAGYLSPEQASGLPVGPAADVYSLGLVLLECLTGTHSYPGTAVESAMARLQRQPEIPDWLGAEWRAVLTGMTAREAEDRLLPAEAAGLLLTLVPSAGVSSADVSPAGVEPAAEAVREEDSATRPLDLPTTLQRQVAAPADPAPTPPPHLEPATAPSRRPRRARKLRRWPLVISGVLVAVLTAGAMLFFVPGAEPPPEPPAYPAVDGPLGDHLEQLQESVDP